jgi:hypothetical protein
MFDVARFVESPQALGECFDLVFCKNEPILGRIVGECFVFMEFQEGRGVFEVAALALGTVGLDVAERVEAPGLGVGDWGLASELDLSWRTSGAVLAWADGDFVG